MTTTTGPHRSRHEYLQGLIQRKRFLCGREPAWEHRGPRECEIASLDRQIDHLLDHWRLRQLSKVLDIGAPSPAVEPSPSLTERALRKDTT